MRFFSGGKIYDFMRWRFLFVGLSLVITVGSLALLAMGKARLGTDFKGGTEIEVAFLGHVTVADIRGAVGAAGFGTPDVIKVDDPKNPDRYLIRVQEVSVISHETQVVVERKLCFGANLPAAECPAERQATEVKFSPGGDKISVRFNGEP